MCVAPRRLVNGSCLDGVCGVGRVEMVVGGVRKCVCAGGWVAVGDGCVRCGGNASWS